MELLPCSTILKACSCFVKLDIPDNAYIRISQYLIIRKGWHTSPLLSCSINNPMWSPRAVSFQSHPFFSALILVERSQSWVCTLWGPNVGKGSPAPVADLWVISGGYFEFAKAFRHTWTRWRYSFNPPHLEKKANNELSWLSHKHWDYFEENTL